MLMFRVPPLARSIADRYKDLLEPVPYSLLCAYIALSLFGTDSFSDLVRQAPWVPSLSTLSEGLNNLAPENLNRAMRRLRWSILKKVIKNPDDWAFFFDTTANPKRVAGLAGRGLWATSKGNVYASGFPKLDVGGDSWFDGVPFLQELNKRGFTFNIELKSSRTAKSNVAPNAS